MYIKYIYLRNFLIHKMLKKIKHKIHDRGEWIEQKKERERTYKHGQQGGNCGAGGKWVRSGRRSIGSINSNGKIQEKNSV